MESDADSSWLVAEINSRTPAGIRELGHGLVPGVVGGGGHTFRVISRESLPLLLSLPMGTFPLLAMAVMGNRRGDKNNKPRNMAAFCINLRRSYNC